MAPEEGTLLAVSVSEAKGVRKTNKERVRLKAEWGIEGDAHAGEWHRQVSLLAQESIDKMRALGLEVKAGDFAENLTTTGIDVPHLSIGDRLTVGRGGARDHPDREGVPHPLRHLLSGRRLRDAQRRRLRESPEGGRGEARRPRAAFTGSRSEHRPDPLRMLRPYLPKRSMRALRP